MKNKIVKLIGFAGKAYSGKDTAYEELQLLMVKNIAMHDMQFAAGVKLMCAQVYQVSAFKFYTAKHEMCEKYGLTYRELMQKFATDFARNMIDKDFWVKYLAHEYAEITATNVYDLISITDIRFDNEAKWIRDRGGIIVNIEKDDVVSMNHSSEIGISKELINFTVKNNGSKKALRNMLELQLHSFLNA